MARYLNDLDVASALEDADTVLIEQSGVDKKSTIAAIKTAVDSYTKAEIDSKQTISTSDPSGGSDGDLWFVREA